MEHAFGNVETIVGNNESRAQEREMRDGVPDLVVF